MICQVMWHKWKDNKMNIMRLSFSFTKRHLPTVCVHKRGYIIYVDHKDKLPKLKDISHIVKPGTIMAYRYQTVVSVLLSVLQYVLTKISMY